MAPRRAKKAVATAIEEVVAAPTENGAEPVVKAETKAKKKTATKKNAKHTEQIESAKNGENVAPVKIEAKPKKAAAKKNAKTTEQDNNIAEQEEIVNGASSPEKKKSSRGKKKKEEESPKVVSKPSKVTAKATKGGKAKDEGKAKKTEPKPVEDIEQTGSSKAAKTGTKVKVAKQDTPKEDVINESIEAVPVTKVSKRGAKKASPKKPVKTDQPAKSKEKKVADTVKKTTKSTKRGEQLDVVKNEQTNNEVDSAKGHKHKAATVKSSPKKAKYVIDSTDAVDGGGESKPGKKRKASTATVTETANEPADELVTKRKKSTKSDPKADSSKAKMNPTVTDHSNINFEIEKEFTLKIVSWNVAGLRGLIGKSGFDYFEYEKPDIICLQEIKCLEEEVPEAAKLKGYHPYWCSTPGGRGGVAILSKSMPYHVEYNIGDEEMDEEGRIITAEYSKFFLVCVYVPNAGRKLVNMDRRMRWNTLFEEHVKKLKEKKPVIICGDMNVAHAEIDLANPKTNRKNAGFTDQEREGMTNLLGLGFIDTFREIYPTQEKAYTFWSYMGNNRAKNVGWRLDYSIVSENLKSKVVDSFIRPQILGSDHCPIVLTLSI